MTRFCMLIVILLACITAISGCNRLFHREQIKPKPPVVEIKEKNKSEAEQSWDKRVADAKSKISKETDVIFGHEAYHEYNGQSFGVMIIGWKDSEYVVDLYRYNPVKKGWENAPTHVSKESGYEYIDTASVSKKWGIPEEIIKKWLDDAEKAAKKNFAGNGG